VLAVDRAADGKKRYRKDISVEFRGFASTAREG